MESAQHPQAVAMVGPENRLTVSLLMVWTFAVAVVLVWHQPWVVVRHPHPGPLPGGEGEAIRLLVAPAVGCGVGSVLYWLVPGLRRNAFPCQPGHWLLLAFGFFWIVAAISPRFWLVENQPTTLAGLLATSAVLAIGSCVGKMLLRWRLGLLMLAAALVWRCYLLGNGLEGAPLDSVFNWRERELFLCLNWTSTVLLVGLAVADWVLSVRRDILHFAGIAVTIALLFVATERYLGFLPWKW
ncbi:MAG: hypothetical protein IAF94_20510 [Pirellulaceae bacterium]|nr:hypothetical protein [Pirellulaceae bacterium]